MDVNAKFDVLLSTKNVSVFTSNILMLIPKGRKQNIQARKPELFQSKKKQHMS